MAPHHLRGPEVNLPHRLHPEEDPAKIVRPAYSDHLLCDNPVCPDLINHDLQPDATRKDRREPSGLQRGL